MVRSRTDLRSLGSLIEDVEPASFGIYVITNIRNQKQYVGQTGPTEGFFKRWGRHLYHLNKENHPNKHLQASWRKYGPSAFSFAVLEEVFNEDLLASWEEVYFVVCGETPERKKPAYNKTLSSGTTRGFRHSNETKEKLSRWRTGRKIPKIDGSEYSFTDEHRRRISLGHKGKKKFITPEQKNKNRAHCLAQSMQLAERKLADSNEPVRGISVNTGQVVEYASPLHAQHDEHYDFRASHIRAAIKKRQSHRGFKWCRLEHPEQV